MVEKNNKQRILVSIAMLLGLLAMASSLYSVQPASDYRYQKMLERDNADSDSVTNDEWIGSKDDAGMTALALIVIGGISFFITSVAVVLIMLGMDVKKLTTVGYTLSVAWILLGGALHAFVWLI